MLLVPGRQEQNFLSKLMYFSEFNPSIFLKTSLRIILLTCTGFNCFFSNWLAQQIILI